MPRMRSRYDFHHNKESRFRDGQRQKYFHKSRSRSPRRSRSRTRSPVLKRSRSPVGNRPRSRPDHRKHSHSPSRSTGRRQSSPRPRSSPPRNSSSKYSSFRQNEKPAEITSKKSMSPVRAKKSPSPERHKGTNRERKQSDSRRDRSGTTPAEVKSEPPPTASRSERLDTITSIPIHDVSPTTFLLGKRFRDMDDECHSDFEIEDNITIAIQRKGPNLQENPSGEIQRDFREGDELMIKRSKGEGKKPLFDRPEILKFGHDKVLDDEIYEEKRTVSVMSTDRARKRSHSNDNEDRYRDKRKVVSRSSREPVVKYVHTQDTRFDSMYQHDSYEEEPQDPSDLRHNLKRRQESNERYTQHSPEREADTFDARNRLEAKRRNTDFDREETFDRSQQQRPYHNYRQRSSFPRRNYNRGRYPRYNRGQNWRGARGGNSTTRRWSPEREKEGEDSDKDSLPDFKNRDKRYAPWEDKPEMIPKNPLYYEHDERESHYNRDRPFMRGRRPFRRQFNASGGSGNSFRGSFRGNQDRPLYKNRDYRRQSDKFDEWKHDKFEEEDGERKEEEPSSTT